MIKPTVIKTEEKKEDSKPTVIQPTGRPMPASDIKPELGASRIKVSVIESPVEKSEIVESKADLPEIIQPTSMAGYKRDRLAITLDDLKTELPENTTEDLDIILQMILETNLDTLDRSAIMFWKSELQKAYSDKVLILLEFSQNDILEKAQSHTQRVIEILEAIDLIGVFEYGKNGLISRLLKSSNNTFDTPEELKKAELELNQLTSLLKREVDVLASFEKNLTAVNDQVDKLAQKIRLASQGALVLKKYLMKSDSQLVHLGDLFEERAMSLTKSFAQIQANEISRQVQLNHVLKLISTIQESILVLIPDWLSSISSMRSMIEMQKMVTQTEVTELVDRKKKILKLLK